MLNLFVIVKFQHNFYFWNKFVKFEKLRDQSVKLVVVREL